MKAPKEYVETMRTDIKKVLENSSVHIQGDAPKIGKKTDDTKSMTIEDWLGVYKHYDLSKKRAIWDLFHRVNGRHNQFYYTQYMYNVLKGNDSHIDTAIKQAIKGL